MGNAACTNHNLAKGILAGAAAGVVATAAMSLFQAAQSKGSEIIKKTRERQKGTSSLRASRETREQNSSSKQSQEEPQPATVKAAQKVVHAVTGKDLQEADRAKGGSIVHYSFGTLMGALYGAVSEYSEVPRRGYGLGFGSALFLLADEIGVPALGLSASPTRMPPSVHLNAWIWHAVYGTTAEAMRGLVRGVI